MAATHLGDCIPHLHSSCHGAPARGPLLLLCWAPHRPQHRDTSRGARLVPAGAAESGPGPAQASPSRDGAQGRQCRGRAEPLRGLELPRHKNKHKHCRSSATSRHGQTRRAAEQGQSPAPSPRAAGPSCPRLNRSTHNTDAHPPSQPLPPRISRSYLATMSAASSSPGNPLTTRLKAPQPTPTQPGSPSPGAAGFG